MTKLTRLLIAAFLLLPSIVRGADYSTYDNVIFCLTDQTQQPTRFWEGAIGSSSPAVPTEFARFVEMGITGCSWRSASSGADANRPQVVTGGGLLFGTISATSRHSFMIYPATDPCRQIHENGILDLWMSFETNASTGNDSVVLIDNTNFSGTLRGFSVSMTNGLITARINNGSAAAVALSTVETCNDNTRHLLHFHANPGNGNCSLRVDKSTRVYGTLGTLGSGAANIANVSIGNRGGGQTANDFEGTIWNVVGSIGPISAAQEAEFIEDNPYGNIVGHPELLAGDIHLNLHKTYYYVPTLIYFAGLRISDPTDGDGAVYAWDDSSGWQGSGHGAGAPPEGGETVLSTSVTVDGAADTFEDGGTYDGSSVRFERRTSTVAFSEQLHRVGISGNTKTDYIRMTRNGTAGSGGTPGVLTMYPIRNTRDVSFTAYIALDEDGEVLEDDTLLTSSGIVGMPSGTRAIAQFSSTLGVMALVVMTKGHEIPGFRHIIIGTAQNMRNYQEIQNYQTNVSDAEGTQFEMASTTKFYETDAGSWKALAAEEMLAILNPPKGNQRIGLGIGIGLGSMERKNPAQKLAAAFNHEFSVAP